MIRLPTLLGATALSLFAASFAQADTVTLTDIAGRQVQVETPVQRVILGEVSIGIQSGPLIGVQK